MGEHYLWILSPMYLYVIEMYICYKIFSGGKKKQMREKGDKSANSSKNRPSVSLVTSLSLT